MGEVNGVPGKWKRKKWGKEEWIILILIGVFLCVIFWPAKEKEETISAVSTDKTVYATEQNEEENYRKQMEERLEDVLKSIDGIDNVRAMITLKNSEEAVILKEVNKTFENTREEDNQGGIRNIQTENKEEVVCYENQGDLANPYVIYTVAPTVEGVLVVVGGEKANVLRTQIVKAVQALFDVDSHKVVVIKMKDS